MKSLTHLSVFLFFLTIITCYIIGYTCQSSQHQNVFNCIIFHISWFSLVNLFLFTNLPFSLVSMLLIPAGLIYMLLPESIPGINLLGWTIERMTNFLMYIVESFSLFPWAAFAVPFDFFDLLLGYAFLFLLVIFIYKKRPLFLLLSCLFLALLFVKFLLETLWSSAI